MKGCKLLPHEKKLLAAGELKNTTHEGASAVWLTAPSSSEEEEKKGFVHIYRPMGDKELLFLLEHGILPDTQPPVKLAITHGRSCR